MYYRIMNIFVLGSFLLITLDVAYTLPVAPLPKTFIEAIKEKCHLSVVDSLFGEMKPIQECPDWDELNHTDIKLNRNNEKKILCLLFYDTFISFCGDIKKLNVSDVKLDLQVIQSYFPEQVCKNLFPANKTLEHDLAKIIVPEKCEKLCTAYEQKEPVLECSLAFYFAQFDKNFLVPKQNAASNTVQNSNQIPSIINNQQAATVNTDLIGKEAKLVKNANPVPNPIVNNPSNLKSKADETDSNIGKNTSKSNSVIQPEPNPSADLHNQHQHVEGTLQSKPTKLVEDQVSNHEKSKDFPIQQNMNSALAKSTPEENLVAGPPLNEGQPELGTNEDENNAEKGEGPQQMLNSDMEEDGLAEQDDEDFGIEQQEPPAAAQDVPQDVQAAPAAAQDVPQDVQAAPATAQHVSQDVLAAPVAAHNAQAAPAAAKDVQEVPVAAQNVQAAPEAAQVLQAAPVSAVDNRPDETENSNTLETAANEESIEELDGGSYFFSYFMVICVFFVLGYVGYHNRIKVMALVLEGKRNKRQYRGRRPNSANYHKLDSNLEEAISSTCTKNANNVIY